MEERKLGDHTKGTSLTKWLTANPTVTVNNGKRKSVMTVTNTPSTNDYFTFPTDVTSFNVIFVKGGGSSIDDGMAGGTQGSFSFLFVYCVCEEGGGGVLSVHSFVFGLLGESRDCLWKCCLVFLLVPVIPCLCETWRVDESVLYIP